MLADDVIEADSSRLPTRLAVAIDGLAQAAVKLRALAPAGDAEESAAVIGAMLRALRDDLERLRVLDDRIERVVLAEQMATSAEELASAAALLRDTAGRADEVHPSVRAAVDVSFHSTRLAFALRCMGAPTLSLAVH